MRTLNILIALLAIAGSANAQSLSFEVQANEAKISLAGATEMTALQFNLKLPEGVSVDTSKATLGSATDGHTLCIETLDNGDLLFVLYSMDLNMYMLMVKTLRRLILLPVCAYMIHSVSKRKQVRTKRRIRSRGCPRTNMRSFISRNRSRRGSLKRLTGTV